MNNGSRKHFRSVRPPASSIDVLLLWPPNIIGCPEGGTTIVGRRPPSLTTAAVTFKLDGWTLSLIDVRVLLLFIRFPRQQATTTTIMVIFLRTVRGVSLFTAQTRLKINKLPHMKGRQSASLFHGVLLPAVVANKQQPVSVVVVYNNQTSPCIVMVRQAFSSDVVLRLLHSSD